MLFSELRLLAARVGAATLIGLAAGCDRSPSPSAATAPSTQPATPAVAANTATATAPATPVQRRPADGERPRQSTLERVPVETAAIVRGPISAFLPFNTTLETEAMVDIFPQTTGQVEALLVEEGKIVKAGDPLLKIEDTEMRIDADESRANYEQLKRNFSRSEELFASKLINKQDHENQNYQLEQARLRYERATLRHSYTTVRAPFDGVIATREAQVGARVASGTKLFSMVKLDEIVGRVFVPGRYLSVVKLDQPAVVTSEFLPDRIFKGWVKRISPVIDPKSGTFKVTVGVRGEKPAELPPGLFVNVRIITETRPDALLVPKRAIVYEGGERYFFTVTNEIASKRKLQAGYEDPQNIEAIAGVEPGTHVIVVGHAGLKDGAVVRTVNALAPVPIQPEAGLAKEPPAPAAAPHKT
ncbi:MAG: efflux RND transporter periplasmic adaptor subunit [Opitutaceae bacterium]|nr:efflux RND transporter periplasmic adaptor subunit [Opitutaceae bacterium]